MLFSADLIGRRKLPAMKECTPWCGLAVDCCILRRSDERAELLTFLLRQWPFDVGMCCVCSFHVCVCPVSLVIGTVARVKIWRPEAALQMCLQMCALFLSLPVLYNCVCAKGMAVMCCRSLCGCEFVQAVAGQISWHAVQPCTDGQHVHLRVEGQCWGLVVGCIE